MGVWISACEFGRYTQTMAHANTGQEKDSYIIKQSGFQSKEEFQAKVSHFIMMKDKFNKKT